MKTQEATVRAVEVVDSRLERLEDLALETQLSVDTLAKNTEQLVNNQEKDGRAIAQLQEALANLSDTTRSAHAHILDALSQLGARVRTSDELMQAQSLPPPVHEALARKREEDR